LSAGRRHVSYITRPAQTPLRSLCAAVRRPARGAARGWGSWGAARQGETGQPLVDANMRELALTGFMSNRGRQNVASFLTQNLHVDWRLGAAYFEEVLIDHDVTANWGNWHAAAGVTGGRVNRFNILKQSSDYDASGDYVRLWLPELARVPAAKVHQPWSLTAMEQLEYQVSVVPPGAPAGASEHATYPTKIKESPPQSMGRGDEGGRDGGGGRGGRGGGRGGGGRPAGGRTGGGGKPRQTGRQMRIDFQEASMNGGY